MTQTLEVFGTAELPLAYPECALGIGDLILTPDSPKLIDGVVVKPFPIWPDDRGYFAEILRVGKGVAGQFPTESTQISAVLSYPGTIKAFHYHMYQTDCWQPMTGMFQVALVDLRLESRTFGARNTMYVGALRPCQVVIPPGIAHGYKVVGTDSGVLVYVTDRHYNPADEGRIKHDHPLIRYDWETQHK
jgi:dTDP-4-dehydrorhamnose 3,5-epimerase